MAEDDQDVKPEILQSVIDTFANRLVGLRTQCSTSNELTQSEIRALEVNITFCINYYLLYVNIIMYGMKSFILHIKMFIKIYFNLDKIVFSCF